MKYRAHIGLGANLDDPPARLRWALTQIAALGRIAAQSPLYRSAPMGPPEQPDFCNAVCVLDTDRVPAALMSSLLEIEQRAGRMRLQKWGPRTLDLDLLHVENVVMASPELTLPHPGIASRNFVLVPWADIAPALAVPGVGVIGVLAQAIGRGGLDRWGPEGG